MKKRSAFLILFLASLVGWSQPAHADNHTGAERKGNDTAKAWHEIAYLINGQSPGRAPGGGAPITDEDVYNRWCHPGLSPYVDGSTAQFVNYGVIENPEWLIQMGYDTTGVYGLYVVMCTDGAGNVQQYNAGGLLIYEITPPVDPTVLRDRAMASVTVGDPQIGMSPPGTVEHFSVVQEQTWLWVANDWTTQTAVERQGFVAVEVQVRPSHVTWEMGDAHARWNDGGSVDCFGPGTPYSDQAYPQGTDCGYTYRTATASEPDLTYEGSATIHWEASWSINGADQGVFTTLSPSATFEQAVGEIQAVIVDEPCRC